MPAVTLPHTVYCLLRKEASSKQMKNWLSPESGLAAQPVWYFAPLAMLGVGVGFYMLHNTLQTEATQMVPQARGTGVTLFASMYFLGQTLGVTLGAPVMDRYGGPPLFVIAAIVLAGLAFWFTGKLKRR